MYEIKDYCHILNKHRIDMFKKCQEQGGISRTSRELDDLNTKERAYYDKEVLSGYKNYGIIWRQIIELYSLYKYPNLVNNSNLAEMNS